MDRINKTGTLANGGGATQVTLRLQGAQIIPSSAVDNSRGRDQGLVNHLNDDQAMLGVIQKRMRTR